MHIDLVNTTLNAKIFSNAHTPFMAQEMHTTTCIFIKYPYKGIIRILILLQCISQVDIPT